MGRVKEQVIEIIKRMPDEATVDDIFSELYFKSQVDAGLKELDEGKGIPHHEVRERLGKWAKK